MYSIYYGNARWWEQFVNNSIIPEMKNQIGHAECSHCNYKRNTEPAYPVDNFIVSEDEVSQEKDERINSESVDREDGGIQYLRGTEDRDYKKYGCNDSGF